MVSIKTPNGIVCSLQKNYRSTEPGIKLRRNPMANSLHYSTLSISALHYSNCYQLRSWENELQYHQEFL